MTTATVSELLASATERTEVRPADGKSTSTFEKVVIDGERYFLKRLSPASDWIMRVSGDHVHRPFLIWSAGLMDGAPPSIDHTVVAMELTGASEQAELCTLMRDVGPALVPEGDSVVAIAQHRGFVEHLTDLSVRFWGWTDTIGGLSTMDERVRFFDAPNVARELAVPEPPGTIVAADKGWRTLRERVPWLYEMAQRVHTEPGVVTEPLSRTPATFLHGDWKMGNLGSHTDGRTILIDWAYPGRGPVCWDLCWYLALNRARLPESKEATIARLRAALEHRGIDTTDWFDEQLDLCLVAMIATFGWEKALGDDAELRWWHDRASEAVRRRRLDLPSAPR